MTLDERLDNLNIAYYSNQAILIQIHAERHYNGDTDKAGEDFVERYAALFHDHWVHMPEIRPSIVSYFEQNYLRGR